jgi:predicted transcriptional regulator
MAETSHCALTESVVDEIRFLASSLSRISVLEYLTMTRATKAEVRAQTCVPASTVSRNLTELREHGMVAEDVRENVYEATTAGEIALDALTAAAARFDNVRVAASIREFVDEDEAFPATEPMLDQCSVIRATSLEPQAPLTRLIKALSDAETVRGLAPHLSPATVDTLSAEVPDGADVRVGVSASALDALQSHYEERTVTFPAASDALFEATDLPEYGVALVDDRVVCGFCDEKGLLAAVFVSPRKCAAWVEWAQDLLASRFEASSVTPPAW